MARPQHIASSQKNQKGAPGRTLRQVKLLKTQDEKARCIVFLEPHGMVHAKAYMHDEKARLNERLRELAPEISRRSGRQDVTLNAFIISATPFNDLRLWYGEGSLDQ
ncbi:MAG: hypothetical protein D6715_09375, partial [Calditrichaeota bacterium]